MGPQQLYDPGIHDQTTAASDNCVTGQMQTVSNEKLRAITLPRRMRKRGRPKGTEKSLNRKYGNQGRTKKGMRK